MVREIGVLFDDAERMTLLRSIAEGATPDLGPTIQRIYDGYPSHSLHIEDVYRRFGEAFKQDVAKYSDVLAERPYTLQSYFVREHGLELWDWITLLNGHLRFSHAGIPPVFSFEDVE